MVREFFVLAYDDREDLESVSDYEMGDFDLTRLWTGERFFGRIPRSVRLWVEKGKPCDYLSNPISWKIVSERFWTLIRPYVRRQVQTLSVPLYYEETRKPVRGYKLLNPLCCVSAVRRKSDAHMQDLRLLIDRIPPNVHLFRLAESPTRVLMSDFLLSKIRGKGLTGLALLRTESISGRR